LHIAITGASSGIGAALAERFAREPGVRLSLMARRQKELDRVVRLCSEKGAKTKAWVVDVRDSGAVARWFAAADSLQPVDIVIVAAGAFDGHGPGGELETADEARTIVDTNLAGAIFTAQAAMNHMVGRRSGQIVFVASLAALAPLADAPTYSATKAGLVAYATAIREHLADHGVEVLTILPGHVRTAQTEQHVGPTPWIIEPAQAAERIHAAIQTRKSQVAFPPPAHALVRLAAMLPWQWRAWASRSSRFYVRKVR